MCAWEALFHCYLFLPKVNFFLILARLPLILRLKPAISTGKNLDHATKKKHLVVVCLHILCNCGPGICHKPTN